MERFRFFNGAVAGLIGLLALVFASTAIADACKISEQEGQDVTVWNSTRDPMLATVTADYCLRDDEISSWDCEEVSASEAVDPKSQKTIDLDVTAYTITPDSPMRKLEDVSVYCE